VAVGKAIKDKREKSGIHANCIGSAGPKLKHSNSPIARVQAEAKLICTKLSL
jgi:hypothetical protein